MKRLIRKLVEEQKAGQAPGKLELVDTSWGDFLDYLEELRFEEFPDKIPELRDNYEKAVRLASMGWTERREMPVINEDDVKDLQKRLRYGYIDVRDPWHETTDPKDPYPEGLSGEEAEIFLNRGLWDGDPEGDRVDVDIVTKRVGDMIPIQEQIYVDKSVDNIAKFGVDSTIDFLTCKDNYFITSNDDYILDGHHRFLSGILINPDLNVQSLEIELPITKLLPLLRAYSDAVGNPRNL